MSNAEMMELFAEGLEVDASSLTPETRIAEVEEWNSIGWLTIMSLVDERLGVQIDSKSIRGFQTVQDVIDYLGGKTASVA
ncbi:MAG: acyl carrier protein [Gemmatimonadetes bacterium]|nr:acyl carrier protein [Gemmatimonadota bacterium]